MAGYEHRIYKTPCPWCGGQVHLWSFDSDDRYKEGSTNIHCRGCNLDFTLPVWESIARVELQDQIEAREKLERDRKEKEDAKARQRASALSKLTEEDKKALGLDRQVHRKRR